MKTTRLILLLPLVAVLAFSSCKKLNSKKNPDCIDDKISEFTKDSTYDTGGIWKWEVDKKWYFYVSAPCCDQFNYLYDEDCNIICAPDGGIAGTGDGNCPDWVANVPEESKEKIWDK